MADQHAEAARELLALKDRLAKIEASVPGVVCSYRLHADGSASMPISAKGIEDLYGLSQQVVAESMAPVFARLHRDDVDRVRASIQAAASAMSPWHDEFRYDHPTKGQRWLEGWSMPVAEPEGSILWHGFVMDVTDRKRAEAELHESDARKSEFLGVLSHELRNPLAPILNSIYLLERVPPGGEQATRAREVIRRQTEHLTRLVDDLLDVTRIERGKVALRRSQVNLRHVVNKTTDDLQSLFDDGGVALRVEHSAGPAWVDADPTRLTQVLGNLLQNAVKFTPPGGTVVVSLRADEGHAELRVRDDGIGIEAAHLERMFQPFVQSERSLARTRGGLGLGLALVKGLVELHGGTVEARSEGVGRGRSSSSGCPSSRRGRRRRAPGTWRSSPGGPGSSWSSRTTRTPARAWWRSWSWKGTSRGSPATGARGSRSRESCARTSCSATSGSRT